MSIHDATGAPPDSDTSVGELMGLVHREAEVLASISGPAFTFADGGAILIPAIREVADRLLAELSDLVGKSFDSAGKVLDREGQASGRSVVGEVGGGASLSCCPARVTPGVHCSSSSVGGDAPTSVGAGSDTQHPTEEEPPETGALEVELALVSSCICNASSVLSAGDAAKSLVMLGRAREAIDEVLQRHVNLR
jgi:hypothetical protein